MPLFNEINKRLSNLTKSQKRIASFILKNKIEILYMTSSEIADRSGVSESTLVRFLQEFGFTGYKELQNAVKTSMLGNLDLMRLYEESVKERNESSSIVMTALNEERININKTFSNIQEETLHLIADRILSAKRIAILGYRGTVAPASVLNTFLNQLLGKSILLYPGIGDPYEYLINWGKEDLVITFDYTPANKKTITYYLAEMTKEQGCYLIAIIRDPATPVSFFSDITVQMETHSPYVSFTSSIVFVNVLLHILNAKVPEDVLLESYRSTEKILSMTFFD